MERLTLLKGIYGAAVENGFTDPIRAFSPDATQNTYEEWLITSGYFRALFCSLPFMEALDRYFQDKEIHLRSEGQDMTDIMKSVLRLADPLSYFGTIYTVSLGGAHAKPYNDA